jgi:hypothetical protein
LFPTSGIKANGSFGTFDLTTIKLMLLCEGWMNTSWPLHFDGSNLSYYIARRAWYLKAIDLGVWRVTQDEKKPIKNPKKLIVSDEKEMRLNSRAKNFLFEPLRASFGTPFPQGIPIFLREMN